MIQQTQPTIANFTVLDDPAPERAVRFAPTRMGHIDRARTQAMRDYAEAEAKHDRLMAEQDRIIRESAELAATMQFLQRTIQAADAIVDRG